MEPEPLERVLVVDDEEDIQTVARLALEKLGGLCVETCGSGREALEKAPAFAPQMILLDVLMPGLDGPSTLGELRRIPELSSTPIVFITARAQQEEVERYLSLGALSVIFKPFAPLTLSDSLREIWRERLRG